MARSPARRKSVWLYHGGAPLPLFLKLQILKRFKSFVLKMLILKGLRAIFG
jgi:hypothetical protein